MQCRVPTARTGVDAGHSERVGCIADPLHGVAGARPRRPGDVIGTPNRRKLSMAEERDATTVDARATRTGKHMNWERQLRVHLAALSILLIAARSYPSDVALNGRRGSLQGGRNEPAADISRRGERRGHIFVIDHITTDTVARYGSVQDLVRYRNSVIVDDDTVDDVMHGYYVAQEARLGCLTCPITILNAREAPLSTRLQEVLDIINAHGTEQVVINISFSVGDDILHFDMPRSETIIGKLIATGRAVVVAATANYMGRPMIYPAMSSRVITVGSLQHHWTFVTKVDVVTREYESSVGGMDHKGNSLAAPQISALIAWIVSEYPTLSMQDAAHVVLNTTDLVWHKDAADFVKVVNETRAIKAAKALDDAGQSNRNRLKRGPLDGIRKRAQ